MRRAPPTKSRPQQALLILTMTNIRTVVGSMDLDQLLSHRDEINERLLRVLDAAASPWGVKITRIEIKDILPPDDIAGAMARQMKAEREKRAAVLEAEGLRQAEILRAEGHKQSQILAAEGRKEAAFRDAEARERQAEAEAKATSLVSDAISAAIWRATNFLIAEKYIEALHAMAAAPNQKVLIVPIEAARLPARSAASRNSPSPCSAAAAPARRPASRTVPPHRRSRSVHDRERHRRLGPLGLDHPRSRAHRDRASCTRGVLHLARPRGHCSPGCSMRRSGSPGSWLRWFSPCFPCSR